MPHAREGPGSSDGQLELSQGREGQGVDRGERLRASLPAVLLSGFQPHREQAFSKLKSYLREACARSHETLMEVIGEALCTISASDAESFFDHCGYRTVVQSL